MIIYFKRFHLKWSVGRNTLYNENKMMILKKDVKTAESWWYVNRRLFATMVRKIFICILHISILFQNIVIGGKYDFAVFENFEETRKIFIFEMKIVSFLDTINKMLLYKVRTLDQMIKTIFLWNLNIVNIAN